MRRVLVIDDDPQMRGVLADLLADAGYLVTAARDGAEGLRLARERAPDVVTLDLELPGMSGHAVLDSLRSDPVLRATPVVVVSGALDWTPRPAGVAAAFGKPFDIDRLLRVIREVAPLA